MTQSIEGAVQNGPHVGVIVDNEDVLGLHAVEPPVAFQPFSR
jgi:hypothetical protein